MLSEQTLVGGRAMSGENVLSRRDFLKLGGVGLAGVAVLGASGCGGGGEGSGNVVFSSPEFPGRMRRLIDRFNEQNKGKVQAAWRQIDLEPQQYFDRVKTEFQAGGGETDVIVGNEPWTAELAENGWIT